MKLQFRITLLIFAILLIFGSAGAGVALYYQRRAAISRFEQSALALASVLERSLEREMLNSDPSAIQSLVNTIASSASINEVAILSRTGKIYASGDISDIGDINSDPQITGSLASSQPVTETKKVLGRNEVSIILPVNNKPVCYSCHGQTPVLGAIEIGVDRGSMDDQLRSQTLILILMGVIMFAGIWIALFFMFRVEVGKPLSSLVASAKKIAGHDFSARANIREKDEVGVLGHAFNEMAERIEQYSNDLEASKRELENRVAQRTTELLSQSRDLSAINVVTAAAVHTLDISESMNSALEIVLKTLSAEAGIVHLINDEQKIILGACLGLPPQVVEKIKSIEQSWHSMDHNFPSSKAAREGNINDYHYPELTGQLAQSSLQYFASAPLLSKGRVIGIIDIFRTQDSLFFPENLRLLESVAHTLAMAAENSRLYEEVQRREKIRGQLLEKLLSAQEDERKRIARDLHDESAQGLIMVMMDLAMMVEALPESAKEAREKLSKSRSQVADTLAGLRKLIQDLRPEVLDQLGLAPAVRSYVKNRFKTENIQVDLNFRGLEDRLPWQIETALFRVVQEAINNVLRHSEATTLTIRMVCEDHELTTIIDDNGKGFDASAALADQESWGLRGIKERVAIVGGELRIDSNQGRGTRMHINIPLKGG